MEDALKKEMANHFSILAWKFHGQRSLEGCSLWGTEESNMTEWLTLRYWVGQNVHSSFFVKCYVCTCANSLQSCLTPWNPMDHIAHQASLSMAFSEHEWSGLPCPPPGDLSDPGIKPMSLTSPALAGRFFTLVPPGKPLFPYNGILFCDEMKQAIKPWKNMEDL